MDDGCFGHDIAVVCSVGINRQRCARSIRQFAHPHIYSTHARAHRVHRQQPAPPVTAAAALRRGTHSAVSARHRGSLCCRHCGGSLCCRLSFASGHPVRRQWLGMGFEELPNQRGKVTVHAVAAIPGATNHIDIVILATTLLHAICNQPTNQPQPYRHGPSARSARQGEATQCTASQPASTWPSCLSGGSGGGGGGGGWWWWLRLSTVMHSQS